MGILFTILMGFLFTITLGILFTISTWSKTRKQYFLEGEERDEIFIFLEPSFWVEDVSASVGEQKPLILN